ncbi:MAG: hypothetical protein DRN11_03820 [Thermoplasmata archaeon]|nr:MAG: hypothetical protein DRN11_03820 [Thermoplasmata archaeon]
MQFLTPLVKLISAGPFTVIDSGLQRVFKCFENNYGLIFYLLPFYTYHNEKMSSYDNFIIFKQFCMRNTHTYIGIDPEMELIKVLAKIIAIAGGDWLAGLFIIILFSLGFLGGYLLIKHFYISLIFIISGVILSQNLGYKNSFS